MRNATLPRSLGLPPIQCFGRMPCRPIAQRTSRPPCREQRFSYSCRPTLIMATLPATLGYHMPAEWEPHEATWIAWPHERTDGPGKFAAIPWVFAEIVRNLHQCEQVNILVNDEDHETLAT